MKLYLFQLPYNGDNKVHCEELDVKEDYHKYLGKMLTVINSSNNIPKGWTIWHEQIGVVDTNGTTTFLWENDSKKAVELFMDRLQHDLKIENERHEENVAFISTKIKSLEGQLNE